VLAVSSTIGLTLKNSVESSQPDSQPTLVATFPMKETTRYHIDVYLDVDSLETYTLLIALSIYNDQHPHKRKKNCFSSSFLSLNLTFFGMYVWINST